VDRELVERGRQGDREAYELLVRTSARRLYGIARRILRDADRAEDAVQQALVDIWLDLPKLRDPDRFEAWTYRLVVRASIAEARRERHDVLTLRSLSDAGPSTPDGSRTTEVRDELDRAFRALTPEHRAVIVLHHHLGLPLTDIASVLGLPYGTVGSRLHYGMRQLRRALEPPVAAVASKGRPA
jgi:RNA polymerase sigma-70 factor (ECF subfamily)